MTRPYTPDMLAERWQCSDELISAVTGQSLAMVKHYTRHVRQRVRAREARERRR